MKRVVLIHDAAIDEYIRFLLLAAMPDVELAGSVIVNADCIGGPAMQTGWAVQSYIGRQDIPLGLSGVRGVNPFPWEYRSDCVKLGGIAPLLAYARHTEWPPYPDGDAWLALLPGPRGAGHGRVPVPSRRWRCSWTHSPTRRRRSND